MATLTEALAGRVLKIINRADPEGRAQAFTSVTLREFHNHGHYFAGHVANTVDVRIDARALDGTKLSLMYENHNDDDEYFTHARVLIGEIEVLDQFSGDGETYDETLDDRGGVQVKNDHWLNRARLVANALTSAPVTLG